MKIILLLPVLSFTFNSIAQNLVLNGDFEDFSKCPKGLNAQEKPKLLQFVTNPNQGNFDFIHVCDDDKYQGYWNTRTSCSKKDICRIYTAIN